MIRQKKGLVTAKGYTRRDGNGISAHYTYDALHRLVNLQSTDSLGNLMQDIDYTFDHASNVTGIVNNAGIVNTLGGNYENSYHYDNLHRLTHSDGGGVAGNYDMDMAYTPSGRIIWKHRNAQSELVSETVNMAYGYCDDYQPHAVKRMFDYNDGMLYDMRWDEAGNLGQVSMAKPGEMFEAGRFLFWTEDCCGPRPCGANRMHAAVDDRYYSYYAYDHSGEHRLKLTGDNKLLDVNADFMATYAILNEPTLYPSAYMVLTNKGYTKHYYAGTERVAARLGGGGLDALYHAIGTNDTIQTKANLLFDQSLEHVNNRVLYENNLDCIMGSKYAKEEFGHWIDGIPYQMQAGIELDHSQFKDMVNSMLDDRNHGQETEVYFYHSDHLGSASWITDKDGIPVQHLQYLPFGEPYINQRTTGYSERFTFTGKERDKETGYGYFGARYMDHELMTMWLSVDPMSDKYPSISPYAYCAWNPLKLVDPDGRDVWELNKSGELIWKSSSEQDEIRTNSGNSITVKNGILTKGKNYTKTDNGGDGYLYLDFGKDVQSAESLFQFFADNSNVEYSLIGYANSKTDLTSDNFILTSSFDERGDIMGSEQAYAYALDGLLRDHTHNHPSGNMQRSGVYDPRVPWTFKEKGNDAGFVSTMKSLLSKKTPSATFNAYIYAGRNRNVAFPNGGYICYSSTKPHSYAGKTYSKATALNRYQRY